MHTTDESIYILARTSQDYIAHSLEKGHTLQKFILSFILLIVVSQLYLATHRMSKV